MQNDQLKLLIDEIFQQNVKISIILSNKRLFCLCIYSTEDMSGPDLVSKYYLRITLVGFIHFLGPAV